MKLEIKARPGQLEMLAALIQEIAPNLDQTISGFWQIELKADDVQLCYGAFPAGFHLEELE